MIVQFDPNPEPQHDQVLALKKRLEALEEILIQMLQQKDIDQSDCYYQNPIYRQQIEQIQQARKEG
jgi:hypothetical protein